MQQHLTLQLSPMCMRDNRRQISADVSRNRDSDVDRDCSKSTSAAHLDWMPRNWYSAFDGDRLQNSPGSRSHSDWSAATLAHEQLP